MIAYEKCMFFTWKYLKQDNLIYVRFISVFKTNILNLYYYQKGNQKSITHQLKGFWICVQLNLQPEGLTSQTAMWIQKSKYTRIFKEC